jgi:hypothetical protein
MASDALSGSSGDPMHDNLNSDAPDQVRPGETMLRMSAEDYLQWEPRMRLKHEFVDGQVYLWPGYELDIGDELREELDGRLYVWTRWR